MRMSTRRICNAFFAFTDKQAHVFLYNSRDLTSPFHSDFCLIGSTYKYYQYSGFTPTKKQDVVEILLWSILIYHFKSKLRSRLVSTYYVEIYVYSRSICEYYPFINVYIL